jgi:amidophosphoribosyltransferase
MADKFEDECGVFGVYNHPDAVALTLLGLQALQHRGQESAGIASQRGGAVPCAKTTGWVSELARQNFEPLKGPAAIGHVRYSTSGESSLVNAQPIVVSTSRGELAMCHNGNVVNAEALRTLVADRGVAFDGDSDTEVVARLFATEAATLPDAEALVRTFRQVSGAYSILMLTADRMYAVRDPFGIRPLSVGRLGGALVFSSETCALDVVCAEHVRDVRPAELLVMSDGGVQSMDVQPRGAPLAQCIFELVYFSRPDSVVFGEQVAVVRISLGRRLAREAPASADIVVPIPDSGLYCGSGYAQESGLPLQMGLVRNRVLGRTFIEPDASVRASAVHAKYNPVGGVVAGKRVVLVDDSLVRGSTCRGIVGRLRAAGATEVHLRVASPPTIGPCYFGVDTPDENELLAVGRSVDEMAAVLGVDSLAFLTLAGLLSTVRNGPSSYCTGCYSCTYPIETAGADSHSSAMVRIRRRSQVSA